MTIDVDAIITDLRAQHLGRNNRRAQTALDVPASVWLWNVCQRAGAERVLELGSGFSTTVLRHWKQHATHDRRTPPVVITLDHEAKWLATTRAELLHEGLSDDGMMLFDEGLNS